MSPSSREVQALFVEWCDAQQELYAVVFSPSGMQACAGRVIRVERGIATLSDTFSEVEIAYDSPAEHQITRHTNGVVSVTFTWPDGRSAFVVTHDGHPTAGR